LYFPSNRQVVISPFAAPGNRRPEKFKKKLSFPPRLQDMPMVDERRKNERPKTPGLKSNITDGKGAFFVVVEDISDTGVGVAEVPDGFDETVHKCFALINAPLKDFNLVLRPRWVRPAKSGKFKRIGFQIEDPPPEWIDFVSRFKKELGQKNQRSSSRHRTFGLMAVVSDGAAKFFGVVEDLSENGLRLTQVPAEFDDSTGACFAVVHSPTGDVNVSLHPCWIRPTNKGMYKTIGFRIHDPPEGWQEMIEELESEGSQLGFLLVPDEESEEQRPEEK
jgi:hypothetical protein